MKVINDIDLFDEEISTSVALGTFDGVHLAHTAVIKEAVNSEFTPAVFTFNQSPSGILSGSRVPMITTKSVKHKIIADLGIKYCFSVDFLKIKDMTAQEFVFMLKDKLGVKKISCGFNFKFGMDGKGNAQVLKELCKKFDIELKVIPPILVDEEPVSSTRIRSLIENGETLKARELLGRPFYYEASVESGNHLGTQLGVPTVNQKFPLNSIIPKKGVYASKVIVDSKEYKGITNIGIKPTIGSDFVTSETNIFDFSGDLYNKTVEIIPIFYIRDERKFEDTDELKRAILNDIEYVKNMIY